MTESEFYSGKADFCHLLFVCFVFDMFTYAKDPKKPKQMLNILHCIGGGVACKECLLKNIKNQNISKKRVANKYGLSSHVIYT